MIEFCGTTVHYSRLPTQSNSSSDVETWGQKQSYAAQLPSHWSSVMDGCFEAVPVNDRARPAGQRCFRKRGRQIGRRSKCCGRKRSTRSPDPLLPERYRADDHASRDKHLRSRASRPSRCPRMASFCFCSSLPHLHVFRRYV